MKWLVGSGMSTDDATFDAKFFTYMCVGVGYSGLTTLAGRAPLPEAFRRELLAVPFDVSFAFDGQFVSLSWSDWVVDAERFRWAIRTLHAFRAGLPHVWQTLQASSARP